MNFLAMQHQMNAMRIQMEQLQAQNLLLAGGGIAPSTSTPNRPSTIRPEASGPFPTATATANPPEPTPEVWTALAQLAKPAAQNKAEPLIFEGRPEDLFDDWIPGFKCYYDSAKMARMAPAEQLLVLAKFLGPKPRKYIDNQSREKRRTLQQVIDLCREKYSAQGMETTMQRSFEARTRKDHESFGDYVDELKGFYHRGYPESSEQTSARAIAERAIRGLDPSLQDKAETAMPSLEPEDYGPEKLVRIVQRLEHRQTLEKGRTRNWPAKTQSPQDPVDDRVEAAKNKNCSNCDQPGHWAFQCPNPQRPKKGATDPKPKTAAMVEQCQLCQGFGHRARDCPVYQFGSAASPEPTSASGNC